jgi:hypothetical protein
MSLYQSLYYMSLVGGLAGVSAWALTTLLAAVLRFPAAAPDLIPAMLLGGLLGALTVAFSDHLSGNRWRWRWTLSGAGLGLAGGALAGLLQIPIRDSLLAHYPVVVRVLSWTLAAGFIGLAMGVRGQNRARIGHPVMGGVAGGVVSGLLFTVAGSSYPDVTNALCFALTGVAITSSLTWAPIVMGEAVLSLVRSADPRAQSKRGKQWPPLQEGDSYTIGSQSSSSSQTRYRREVDVYIPDAAVAGRHATVFAREGRFFLARHDDTRSAAALGRYPLKVRGRNVSSAQQLQHADEILIGRTTLRFLIRTKEGR